MFAEVAAVSPQEYERQQKDDLASSGGVRNTAKFVEALADRCELLPRSQHQRVLKQHLPLGCALLRGHAEMGRND